MVKNKKRSFNEAIMPDDEQVGNKDVVVTEEKSKKEVVNTKKKKAAKITYSLYPTVIEAVEKFAEDNYMSKSQVVTQALRSFIPDEYFNN